MFYSQNRNSKKRGEYIYYYPECKECSIKRSLNWQLDNHEHYLQQKHIYNTSQTKNSESWRQREREHSREQRLGGYHKDWRKRNPEKLKRYSQVYSNKKHDITTKEWIACKSYFDHMCAYCGMSEKEHKDLFKQQLHKEHVDCNGADDLSNCVPACRSCNSSKHEFRLTEWYDKKNKYFLTERLEKILLWINNDYADYLE
ncbi:HNH endonuclease [Paenibacillus sp. T2-29]